MSLRSILALEQRRAEVGNDRLIMGRLWSLKAGRRRLRFSFFADEPNQGSEVGDRHQA